MITNKVKPHESVLVLYGINKISSKTRRTLLQCSEHMSKDLTCVHDRWPLPMGLMMRGLPYRTRRYTSSRYCTVPVGADAMISIMRDMERYSTVARELREVAGNLVIPRSGTVLIVTLSKSETYKETIKEKSTIEAVLVR